MIERNSVKLNSLLLNVENVGRVATRVGIANIVS